MSFILNQTQVVYERFSSFISLIVFVKLVHTLAFSKKIQLETKPL